MITPRKIVSSLSLCTLFLLLNGCGGEQPIDRGSQDMNLLGVGLAEELANALPQGGTVLVYETPGAMGYAKKIEADTLKTMKNLLDAKGVNLQRADYTPSEKESYMSNQFTNLHSDIGAGPLQRMPSPPDAILSFLGTPGGSSFLPDNTLLICVMWAGGSSGSLPSRNILVRPRDGKLETLPTSTPEEALAAFSSRFEVERNLP